MRYAIMAVGGMELLYKPEKSGMIRAMFGATTIILVSLTALFIMSGNIRVKIILVTLMVLTAGIGLYHILLAKTLKFRWAESALYIEGFFGLYRVVLPVESMLRYTRRITLISRSGLLGSITRKYYIGNIIVNDMGKMMLFITNSKNSIYLSTMKGIYGISPEAPDEFCAHLDRLGIPLAEEPDYLDSADRGRARKKYNQILARSAFSLAIATLGPLALYNARMLPPYLMTWDAANPKAIYITVGSFITSHLWYCLFTFAVLVVSGFASKFFKRLDPYYYYRVLYLPASMVFLLIVFFLHALFPVIS